MDVYVGFRNPDNGEIKQVKVGWNGTWFTSVLLLGTPLFELKFKRLGYIALAFFIVNFIAISSTDGIARFFILYPFLCITLGFQTWLALNGSKLTAESYLKRNWTIVSPESELTRMALQKWGITKKGETIATSDWNFNQQPEKVTISSLLTTAANTVNTSQETQKNTIAQKNVNFLKVLLKLIAIGSVVWFLNIISEQSLQRIRASNHRGTMQMTQSKDRQSLPACNSDDAKEGIKGVFEHNAFQKVITLELISFEKMYDEPNLMGAVPLANEKRCVAEVLTNVGRKLLPFTMTPTEDGAVYFQADFRDW